MKIDVKLEAFEGPLDLLLHLIEKNKVNIYDIPIVEITNQYMEYIQEMERSASMESMSEFLVMAATLLRIKSRMLLPKRREGRGRRPEGRTGAASGGIQNVPVRRRRAQRPERGRGEGVL